VRRGGLQTTGSFRPAVRVSFSSPARVETKAHDAKASRRDVPAFATIFWHELDDVYAASQNTTFPGKHLFLNTSLRDQKTGSSHTCTPHSQSRFDGEERRIQKRQYRQREEPLLIP
jgi:hypothetical protein